MSTVGTGVKEIRVSADDLQHRVIYIAKFSDAVYVLHAFIKKEQKTSQQDIQLAKARYQELLRDQKLINKEPRKTQSRGKS